MKTKITLLVSMSLLFFVNRLIGANINIADFSFTPAAITINAGESVTWHWINGTHPTQSDSNPPAWTTFTLGPGNTTFAKTFTTPGKYPYHCQVHGFSMSGTINVLAAPTGILDSRQIKSLMEVYPNPAKEMLTIALQETPEKIDVKVLTLTGKTVKIISENQKFLQNGNTFTISLAGLPESFYVLSVFNKEGILANRRISVLN